MYHYTIISYTCHALSLPISRIYAIITFNNTHSEKRYPMQRPILYRKRIIPDECLKLSEDTIIYQDNSVLVTKWRTIRPKKSLHHGMSCYFLQKGWKVSKFYGHDGQLICWYCDIIDHKYDAANNTYVFRDLLADVLVYEDGTVKVVDLDELADAFSQGLIFASEMVAVLRKLDELLALIYSGKFADIQSFMNEKEADSHVG